MVGMVLTEREKDMSMTEKQIDNGQPVTLDAIVTGKQFATIIFY